MRAEVLSLRHWQLVRRLAAESVHPVSRAIATAAATDARVERVIEVPGRGITALVDDERVVIGSASFLRLHGHHVVPAERSCTWVSVGGDALGWIKVAAPERPGVEGAIRRLGAEYETWMLSGDHDADQARWEPRFGARLRFRQTPEDKLAIVEAMRSAGMMCADGRRRSQ